MNNTIGVSRLISFDGKPKSLPHQLISRLILPYYSFKKLLSPKKLVAGDSVKLLTGPFANFITIVEKIDAKQRIWVFMGFMGFMGQSTRMKVATEHIQIAE